MAEVERGGLTRNRIRTALPQGVVLPGFGTIAEGFTSPRIAKRSPPCLLTFPASLLPIALTRECLLDSEFLARLQIKGVSLDLPDDVFLQDLPFEAAERVFQRLALLDLYLSQMAPPTLRMVPIHRSRIAARRTFSARIIWPLPGSEPFRLERASPSVPCRA